MSVAAGSRSVGDAGETNPTGTAIGERRPDERNAPSLRQHEIARHLSACSRPAPGILVRWPSKSMTNMRIFIISCVAAAVIAIGFAVVLHEFQEPVAVAFTTSAARI